MNVKRMHSHRTISILGATLLIALTFSGCANLRSVFGMENNKDTTKPIRNPFGDYTPGSAGNPNDTMIFRSKRGDGSVEVEIPRANQDVTDFILPVPGRQSGSRNPASLGASAAPADGSPVDNSYLERGPTPADREITRNFSQIPFADEQKRGEIEQGLGLVAADEPTPERQRSYLASIDHIKQLYRGGRYEAGLIEVESMLRDFPTDPKLYQMRGTLLDRLGRTELAVKSWNQALRFNPSNEPLRRFIEKRTRQPAAVPVAASAAPVASAPAPENPSPAVEEIPAPPLTGGQAQ